MKRFAIAARYAWASPATLLGLLGAAPALLLGARASMVRGVVEVSGGALAALVAHTPGLRHFEAVTLGHVVLADSSTALDRQRRHERAHVRQFERWGVFLLPLYLLAGVREWIRGRHPYRDNPFELEARATEGSLD